jgi:hypothetical protein
MIHIGPPRSRLLGWQQWPQPPPLLVRQFASSHATHMGSPTMEFWTFAYTP